VVGGIFERKNAMKIVVTAQGPDLNSPVDERFGRAAFLIVIDTDSGKFESIDNTANVEAARGAGVQTAQRVADAGVEAVVTGRTGPKAEMTLQSAGIKIFLTDARTVSEAVEKFKRGDCTPN
jgi:predicted Fe-Mo cluster-binding NifX family protein